MVGYEECYQVLRDWRHLSSDARTIQGEASEESSYDGIAVIRSTLPYSKNSAESSIPTSPRNECATWSPRRGRYGPAH